MKRYHGRWTTRWSVTARLPTMVTLCDTRFVECRWWNDSWTLKTVVTWRSSASMIPAPGVQYCKLPVSKNIVCQKKGYFYSLNLSPASGDFDPWPAPGHYSWSPLGAFCSPHPPPPPPTPTFRLFFSFLPHLHLWQEENKIMKQNEENSPLLPPPPQKKTKKKEKKK